MEQPGSIQAFESVELFSMVSGYLKTQDVDIGARIKKGEILAVIDVPRVEGRVAEAAALLKQAKAQALLAETKIKTMEADRDTAAATAVQAEADIDRLIADRRLAAVATERTSRLAAETAKSQLAGAAARVEQSRAEALQMRAEVAVAEARLATDLVDLQYAKIAAPFDGVVTRRNFHPGAFIRANSDGNQQELLTVARTDLMRVVVQVPDRDVVFAEPGDPAVVTIDGLEGRAFQGKISRIASSEDAKMRTMRVEIDLPNPDGRLRDGMYGRATIEIEAKTQRLTVPVACVSERSAKGTGIVHVVRNGKIERVVVELGADDGTRVDKTSALAAASRAIASLPLACCRSR